MVCKWVFMASGDGRKGWFSRVQAGKTQFRRSPVCTAGRGMEKQVCKGSPDSRRCHCVKGPSSTLKSSLFPLPTFLFGKGRLQTHRQQPKFSQVATRPHKSKSYVERQAKCECGCFEALTSYHQPVQQSNVHMSAYQPTAASPAAEAEANAACLLPLLLLLLVGTKGGTFFACLGGRKGPLYLRGG